MPSWIRGDDSMVTDSSNGVVSYPQFRLDVSASNLVDGRYPGTLTNAARHAERVDYDQRFGVPKRVTDANGRVTVLSHDPFGRLTVVTSPDKRHGQHAALAHRGVAAVGTLAGVAPSGKALVTAGSKALPKLYRKFHNRPVRIRDEIDVAYFSGQLRNTTAAGFRGRADRCKNTVRGREARILSQGGLRPTSTSRHKP